MRVELFGPGGPTACGVVSTTFSMVVRFFLKVRFSNRPQVGFPFRNLMQWVQLDVPQLAEVGRSVETHFLVA